MVNVGQGPIVQELYASKGTAGGNFGLIFAVVGGAVRLSVVVVPAFLNRTWSHYIFVSYSRALTYSW